MHSINEPRRERALVTGATRGLGWKFAKLLALRGFDLVITGRDEARLEAFRAKYFGTGVDIRTIAADLTAPDGVERLHRALERLDGPVDLLVNNAGAGDYGPFAEGDPDRQQSIIALNVAALVRLTRLVLPGMVARGHGRILNVASTAGFAPGPFMAVYYASKSFVISFSHAIARELAGSGVTVTVLCPGYVETEFAASARVSPPRRPPSLDAEAVAAAGIRALLAGRALVIPGAGNRIAALAARLLPRRAVLEFTFRYNSRR